MQRLSDDIHVAWRSNGINYNKMCVCAYVCVFALTQYLLRTAVITLLQSWMQLEVSWFLYVQTAQCFCSMISESTLICWPWYNDILNTNVYLTQIKLITNWNSVIDKDHITCDRETHMSKGKPTVKGKLMCQWETHMSMEKPTFQRKTLCQRENAHVNWATLFLYPGLQIR